MPLHLIKARLTPEAASHICMNQCKAMCCRGPLILQLNRDEALDFMGHGAALGVDVHIISAPDGNGWVRFSDHEGERCPMLDNRTSACRIYQDRPRRCRDFPERATPGCSISEDV
jgi:Fe-S-cluster containining protein